MPTRRSLPLLLALLAFALTSTATPVVDQRSPYGKETIAVGLAGTGNRIVAQTVTAGVTGDLMQVEVGIGCDSGTLLVEIVNLDARGLPGSAVRARATVDAASLPMPPSLRTFDLDRRPAMNAGDGFAIVLRNETGTCTALKGPEALDGSSYPGGNGWFRRADADGWLQFLDFGRTGDLGFTTIVNVVPASAPCRVNGMDTEFPSWLPACRCIEDAGLRDFRCALMDPSFFLFRHLPMPIRAGEKFTVKWTLVVFADMTGVVEVTDLLPPGFTGAPKEPLTFFVEQVPVGQSLTLQYEAIAPLKPGRYQVETGVRGGQMHTVIDVVK